MTGAILFFLVVVGIRILPPVLRALAGTASDLIGRRRSARAELPRVSIVQTLLRLGCIALGVGGVACAWSGFSTAGTQPTEQPQKQEAVVAGTLPAVSTSIQVDIADAMAVLTELPQSEVADQLRDWSVEGMLALSGFSADTIAKAGVGQAPVRLPYLADLMTFEYGRGRRAIVEDAAGTKVLLFYEKNDPRRVATLARLADRVRMETGETYPSFMVFSIEPAVSDGTIRVHREGDVSRETMFGAPFGYVERRIGTLPEFKSWIESVDDVVYAHDDGSAVVLGGRRFPDARDRGVALEDVVVLYRAQQGAHDEHGPEPGFSLDPHWRRGSLATKLDVLAADPLGGLIRLSLPLVNDPSTDPSAPTLASSSAQQAALWSLENADQRTGLRESHASGLREMAKELRGLGDVARSTSDAQRVDEVANHLFRMRAQKTPGRRDAGSGWAPIATEFLRATEQVQCARYDGPSEPSRSLRGTRVGMNLFYTDVLAKLWVGLDYHRSAPAIHVPGIVSLPRLDLEAAWSEEVTHLTGTRLWFGPRREASSRDSGDATVLFQHVASRVFAAGSDGTESGETEAQPAEDSRIAFGWWDRHFQDVAEYEQEYSLQNQIMKWSVISQWAVERGRLGFLDDASTPVRRDLQLDAWIARDGKTLDLKYTYGIKLRPRTDWVTGTECMDLLASYPYRSVGKEGWVVSGGVSLAGRKAAQVTPRLAESESSALRFNKALGATGEGKNAVGTAVRARPAYEGSGRVAARGSEATRTRWRGLDLDIDHGAVVDTTREGARASFKVLGVHEGRIGELTAVARDRGSVRLAWRPGDVHLKARGAALRVDAPKEVSTSPLLGALEGRDAAWTARALRGAAKGDGARLGEAIGGARREAMTVGFDALAAGDAPRARGLFATAQEAAAEPPRLRMGEAIADLEVGLLGRATSRISGVSSADLAAVRSPTLERLRSKGFSAEEVHTLVAGREVPRANAGFTLASDGGRVEPLLRTRGPLTGKSVDPRARVKLLGDVADGKADATFYVDDRIGLNRHDLEAQGEGVLGELAKDPNASWAQADVALGSYEPELLAGPRSDVRYRRVPMTAPRTRPTRTVRPVYVVHLCRTSDGVTDDACR